MDSGSIVMGMNPNASSTMSRYVDMSLKRNRKDKSTYSNFFKSSSKSKKNLTLDIMFYLFMLGTFVTFWSIYRK